MNRRMRVLVCALALTAASPAAGFGQNAVEIELGDVGSGVEVARLVVATGVSEREPVGAATEFSLAQTTHLYAFVEVLNARAEPTEITVSWIDGSGEALKPYVLQIGAGKRWRTWVKVAAPKQPGTWSVAVSDSSGLELATTPFTITG